MKTLKTILLSTLLMFIGLTVYAQNDNEYPSFSSNDLKIENKIQIYPNPSVDFLKVSIEESKLVDPQIVIHSIIGTKLEVYTQKISANEFSVDVKNLPAGYYLVAIKDASTGFSETYKFLKR